MIELTKREKEFIKLKADGLKMWEIAELLFTSDRSIEELAKNLYEKTGTNNGSSLINWAYLNSILKINVENHNNEERKTG
jgi:two-component system secretion response regulator SsrB